MWQKRDVVTGLIGQLVKQLIAGQIWIEQTWNCWKILYCFWEALHLWGVQKRPRGLMVCWLYHLATKLKSQEEVDWHELRQVGVSILWQGCHGGKVPFLKFQLITCGWVGCENQLLWIPSYFGKWILQIKSSFLNFDDKAHLLHEFKDWHLLAVRTMTPPACHTQSEAEWLQHIQNQYFSRQDLQIGR